MPRFMSIGGLELCKRSDQPPTWRQFRATNDRIWDRPLGGPATAMGRRLPSAMPRRRSAWLP